MILNYYKLGKQNNGSSLTFFALGGRGKEKKTFLRGSALNEQGDGCGVYPPAGGLRLGRGGIPPTPSFRLALAWAGEIFGGGLTILFLAPPSRRGKD